MLIVTIGDDIVIDDEICKIDDLSGTRPSRDGAVGVRDGSSGEKDQEAKPANADDKLLLHHLSAPSKNGSIEIEIDVYNPIR
jgi:hypothetical protein